MALPLNAAPVILVDANGNPLTTSGGAIAVSGGGGSTIAVVRVEMTRPDNATAYGVGDAIAPTPTALIEFPNFAAVAGGSGYLVGFMLTTNLKSITPAIRVHVYTASDPTLNPDNDTWEDDYVDESKKAINYFDLPAMYTPVDATNSTQSTAEDQNLRIPFKCAAGSRSLWLAYETQTIFTPANLQKFIGTLKGDVYLA